MYKGHLLSSCQLFLSETSFATVCWSRIRSNSCQLGAVREKQLDEAYIDVVKGIGMFKILFGHKSAFHQAGSLIWLYFPSFIHAY